MADPVSLSVIGMAASGASGAVGAFGAISGGNSQAAMYNYQAGIANLNSQIAKQNADWAVASGEVEAQQSGMKSRFQQGTTIAQQGAGELAIGSGSNARVVQSEKELGAEDQALIRSNAAKKAYGYEVESVQQEAQANLDTMAAKNAKTAGYLDAFKSILGAAGSVGSKWSSANTAGVFG
ncbi:MAG: hypothetical protein LAO23_19710 [Acidobacteriia bacterium]|nr:hypothetical protein [Terriglobia bacterium]